VEEGGASIPFRDQTDAETNRFSGPTPDYYCDGTRPTRFFYPPELALMYRKSRDAKMSSDRRTTMLPSGSSWVLAKSTVLCTGWRHESSPQDGRCTEKATVYALPSCGRTITRQTEFSAAMKFRDVGLAKGVHRLDGKRASAAFGERSAWRIWLSTVRKEDMHVDWKLPFFLDR
jgi:hypothetical protein